MQQTNAKQLILFQTVPASHGGDEMRGRKNIVANLIRSLLTIAVFETGCSMDDKIELERS